MVVCCQKVDLDLTQPYKIGKNPSLKINLQKSRFLASKNMPWRKVDKIASTLGFQSTQNINNYLDFPLVASRVKKSRFSFIVDKVNVCLVGWK